MEILNNTELYFQHCFRHANHTAHSNKSSTSHFHNYLQSKTPVFNRVKLVLEPFQARTFEICRLFEIKQRQKKGNVFSAQKYLLPPPLAYGTIPEETIGRKTDYSINRSSSYSSTGPVELGGQGGTIAPLPIFLQKQKRNISSKGI